MRRIVQLSLLCLAAGASACSTPDLVNPTEVLPYAGVRFINAVPDSSGAFGLDLRFVDLLESNAHFRITFRNAPNTNNISTQVQYKGAREGSRHFRIFLDDTLQSIASVVVKDTTVTLAKGSNYTAILWGEGRVTGANAMRLNFWTEDVPAPAAGKVALRVINATNTAIDGWAFLTSGTAGATPTWDAVPPYSKSNYVEVDSGAYTYQIRNDGVGTNLFANTSALAGAVPSCSGLACLPGQFADIEANPGTRVSGSAISAIVFPRSTAGARTPQAAAFGVPAISYMWDKRPPRTCDPYC